MSQPWQHLRYSMMRRVISCSLLDSERGARSGLSDSVSIPFCKRACDDFIKHAPSGNLQFSDFFYPIACSGSVVSASAAFPFAKRFLNSMGRPRISEASSRPNFAGLSLALAVVFTNALHLLQNGSFCWFFGTPKS